MPRLVNLSVRIYALLLRLYPRAFYTTFGPEMVDVFAQALQDASRHGTWATARVLFREWIDLPLVLALGHIRERRKQKMPTMAFETERDVRLVRWMARGLATLFAAFILSLFLFNEDVRQNPHPPVVILALLALSMMLAWRWEKLGGRLTFIGSPLLFVSVLYTWLSPRAGGFDPGGAWILGMAVVGAALSLPPLIVGWLFVSLARAAPRGRSHSPN